MGADEARGGDKTQRGIFEDLAQRVAGILGRVTLGSPRMGGIMARSSVPHPEIRPLGFRAVWGEALASVGALALSGALALA